MDLLFELRSRIEDLEPGNELLLNSFIEDAKAFILRETNRTEITSNMNSLILNFAKFFYQEHKRGGEKSRSEGGVSVTYSDELPPHIQRELNSFKRLKIVRFANANKK